MATRQTPEQKETVERVMHEFKHGELETSRGRKVRNPRQAIAIALHEAGALRDETPGKTGRTSSTPRDRRNEPAPTTLEGLTECQFARQ